MNNEPETYKFKMISQAIATTLPTIDNDPKTKYAIQWL